MSNTKQALELAKINMIPAKPLGTPLLRADASAALSPIKDLPLCAISGGVLTFLKAWKPGGIAGIVLPFVAGALEKWRKDEGCE